MHRNGAWLQHGESFVVGLKNATAGARLRANQLIIKRRFASRLAPAMDTAAYLMVHPQAAGLSHTGM